MRLPQVRDGAVGMSSAQLTGLTERPARRLVRPERARRPLAAGCAGGRRESACSCWPEPGQRGSLRGMDADALSRDNARLKARLTGVEAALAEVQEANWRLEGLLRTSQRERFGTSSGKLSPDQFNLPRTDADLAPGRSRGRTGEGRGRACPGARGGSSKPARDRACRHPLPLRPWGDAFTRPDPSQWKSARTTNAIERLNEGFRRRIKTQTLPPCAKTVPMLPWALLASGQIQMRKVDGWETLSQPILRSSLDLAA